MTKEYTPGQDCKCSAYNESECGCGADWTPSEVYKLREQVKNLLSKVEGMGYKHSHLRCQIIQAENVTHRYKDRLQSERTLADRLAGALNKAIEIIPDDAYVAERIEVRRWEKAIDAWKEARSE